MRVRPLILPLPMMSLEFDPAMDWIDPVTSQEHCDAAFTFREPRAFKWVSGTAWGTRHGLTTPATHPGHRKWPIARDVAQGRGPFLVHFKAHAGDANMLASTSAR